MSRWRARRLGFLIFSLTDGDSGRSTEASDSQGLEQASVCAVAYVSRLQSYDCFPFSDTRVPGVVVFAIYADSFLFVFATAILQFGFGVDHSLSVCEAAILLCLVFYVTTKVRLATADVCYEKPTSKQNRKLTSSRRVDCTLSPGSEASDESRWLTSYSQLIYLFLVEKAVG